MESVIQFSGGRTSAFMLRKIIDAAPGGGTLPGTFQVCFENTGKEREETLEFIEEVSQRWGVAINWLEYDDAFDLADYTKPDGTLRKGKIRQTRFKVVDFRTASRHGEPFMRLLSTLREYRKVIKDAPPVLPNPAQRICTGHLKQKVVRAFLRSLGWQEWDLYMGIRADEQHRAAKMRESIPQYECLITPLIDQAVNKSDVNAFWQSQPFNLRLDANSDEGNCDLCFLKKASKLVKIMSADRSREIWWRNVESEFGTVFRRDRPSYAQFGELLDGNSPQLLLFEANQNDKTVDCFCGE